MTKVLRIWSILVLLSLFVVPTCNSNQLQTKTALKEEERAGRFCIRPFASAQKLLKSEDFKDGLPDLSSNVGTLGELTTIDYSAPPVELFKEVGDAIMPVLTVGLSLIPGGALIGGIVSGLWGLFSPLFGGGPSKPIKSPMEIMIDDIKDELKNLRNQIKELAEKIPEQMRKETDAKLSKLVHKAIQGMLKRNDYICNKYALVSKDFSEDLRMNKAISETLRMEMIAYINDCDNFLKDTAEAFVYPEYADVLWSPSVVTTLIRMSFLTEVANYGLALKLDPELIIMFWNELKNAQRQHFKFYDAAVKKRILSFTGQSRSRDKTMNYTSIEYEACKIQAQLLYMDRQMYPYGVPNYFRFFNGSTELKVANFNVTGHDEPRHIQAYYNALAKVHDESDRYLLNCFSGPERIIRVPTKEVSLNVVYVPDKTYEIRILYFDSKYFYTVAKGNKIHTTTKSKYRPITKATVKEEADNTLRIKIKGGKPKERSLRRFENSLVYPFMSCNDYQNEDQFTDNYNRHEKPVFNANYNCVGQPRAVKGIYVVEHVSTVAINPGKELKGKIIVEGPNQLLPDIAILGVEFIVLPTTTD